MTFSVVLDPTMFYIRVPVETGGWQTISNTNALEVTASFLVFLVLAAGITNLFIALLQMVRKSKTNQTGKMSRSHLIYLGLSAFICVGSLLVYLWGFPLSYKYPVSAELGGGIFFMPGPRFVIAQTLSGIVSILGLGMTIFSTIRIRKPT